MHIDISQKCQKMKDLLWRMTLTCTIDIYVSHTSCLYKDAEQVEQNDWTAWPDHSKKTEKENEMRNRIGGVINLLIMLPLPYVVSNPN